MDTPQEKLNNSLWVEAIMYKDDNLRFNLRQGELISCKEPPSKYKHNLPLSWYKPSYDKKWSIIPGVGLESKCSNSIADKLVDKTEKYPFLNDLDNLPDDQCFTPDVYCNLPHNWCTKPKSFTIGNSTFGNSCSLGFYGTSADI